jgi:hypothetical protein
VPVEVEIDSLARLGTTVKAKRLGERKQYFGRQMHLSGLKRIWCRKGAAGTAAGGALGVPEVEGAAEGVRIVVRRNGQR